MSTVELMQTGRKDMKATDAALLRSEKLVNDTMAIGIGTAETLQGQTRQLEKVRRG
jgi:SNARE protein